MEIFSAVFGDDRLEWEMIDVKRAQDNKEPTIAYLWFSAILGGT